MLMNRLLILFSGISGMIAMIAYAASAHGDHALLAVAAPILLGHAPVLLALAILGFVDRQGRDGSAGFARVLCCWAGGLMIIGLLLFNGDLLMRDLLGERLFPFAAPLGGTTLIGSWLLIALSALFRRS